MVVNEGYIEKGMRLWMLPMSKVLTEGLRGRGSSEQPIREEKPQQLSKLEYQHTW